MFEMLRNLAAFAAMLLDDARTRLTAACEEVPTVVVDGVGPWAGWDD